ncbi:MAG: 30S ribosomal protein S21 [Clostridia bacterium]|jgi:ribosomal protein S21
MTIKRITCGPAEFDPNKIKPIEVVVEGSSREDFEHAVRKFKSLFQRERIVGQLKEKMAFEKPSDKKRRKSREAVDRKLLTEMRERMIKTGEWDKRQKQRSQRKVEKQSTRSES